MSKDTGDEVIPKLADMIGILLAPHQVGFPGRIPQAEVDMAAIARQIGKRLGRERCKESVATGYTAYGIAIVNLSIGSGKGVSTPYCDLMLARAIFRMVEIDLDTHAFKNGYYIVNDGSHFVHTYAAET